ncbi:MAG TPA: hypothetical protein VFS40_05825 [Gemmatimonadales bacterium]|nr:hypothetical protein [Gemmatimonadales bacterium]
MRLSTRPTLTLRTVLLAGALGLLLACSDDGTGPDGTTREPGQLNVVRVSPGAPAAAETEVTFWAVAGVSMDTALHLVNGKDYARFKLGSNSLLARPNGVPFLKGDSVEITLRVVDPQQILFELEPSGLKFNPADMAELRIRYEPAEDDFNHDGRQDENDEQIRQQLHIWRQEVVGQLFERLGTVRFDGEQELRAKLIGFSRYAVAY